MTTWQEKMPPRPLRHGRDRGRIAAPRAARGLLHGTGCAEKGAVLSTNGNHLRARLAGGALAAALVLGGGHAAAASVGVTKVTAATNDTARPKNALYNISYRDCKDDIEFTFALSVAAADQSKFQAWVSDTTDCKTSIARQEGGGCKLLAQSFPGSTGKLIVSAKKLAGMLSG